MKSKNDDVFLMNDELFLMGGLPFFDGRIIGENSAIFGNAIFLESFGTISQKLAKTS